MNGATVLDQKTIEAMKRAGISAEQILSVVEDSLRDEAERKAGRREADRMRKRETRAQEKLARTTVASDVSDGQVRTGAESTDTPPPPKESPQTPKEITPTTHKEKTPKGVQKKGSRLPDDFEPDWKFVEGFPITRSQAESEFAKFRDYWAAKAGQGATKADWQATWRNWIRTAAERLPRAGPSAHRLNPTLVAAQNLMDQLNAVTPSEVEGNHPSPRLVAIGQR